MMNEVAKTLASRLTPIQSGVLDSCREMTLRHREILPLLADVVGVPEAEVFYEWAFRRCKQSGRAFGTDWSYFFHGLECDVKNLTDGRFLRFDFGPGGRVDTFTAWGVLQFIMTSRSPWSDFADLREQFAEDVDDVDENSGSFERFTEVWDELDALGAFQPADQSLVDFKEACTAIGADGLRHVQFPTGTPERLQIDSSVAHRPILSDAALQFLDRYRTNGAAERVVPGAA